MQLNEEQKQRVTAWVAEGLGLSDLQKKITTELGLSLTYMDVRFLVLELGLAVKERKQAPAPKATGLPAAAPGADDVTLGDEPPGRAGGVKVELDRVMKAGAVVSGTVRFSDGVTANWFLDQAGRLALDAGGKKGYRPSAQDVAAFQDEIRRALAQQGY